MRKQIAAKYASLKMAKVSRRKTPLFPILQHDYQTFIYLRIYRYVPVGVLSFRVRRKNYLFHYELRISISEWPIDRKSSETTARVITQELLQRV